MADDRIREILKENCIEAPEQSVRAILDAIKQIMAEANTEE